MQMGLGKTAQSIAVLEYQRQVLGIRGPFLVVAPLTTLGHWSREIETWTGMVRRKFYARHTGLFALCMWLAEDVRLQNVVQYTGTKEDREMIRNHEFDFCTSRRRKEVRRSGNEQLQGAKRLCRKPMPPGRGAAAARLTSCSGRCVQVKFDVLLTSYEMLLKDKGTFTAFGAKWPAWQAVIIDEAHRLKALKSATRQIVFDLKHKWLLLLTGVPVDQVHWPDLALAERPSCDHKSNVCRHSRTEQHAGAVWGTQPAGP